MVPEERPLRADAERNRRRLLDAAEQIFGERGLDVGVAEIAQQAGVGRGTLFRNFPTKEHLIAAIVVERMQDACERGRGLLDARDPGGALFEFLDEMVGRQRVDRALFDAVADTFLSNSDIRAAHTEVVSVLDELLVRAQQAGAVRADVSGIDVLMLMKGVCQATSAFAHVDPGIGERHLDLMRAALSPSGAEQPLRGRAPTMADLERAFPASPELAETDAPAATG